MDEFSQDEEVYEGERRSPNRLLVGCGAVAFLLGVLACGGLYYLANESQLDPAQVEQEAKAILTFDLPPAFKPKAGIKVTLGNTVTLAVFGSSDASQADGLVFGVGSFPPQTPLDQQRVAMLNLARRHLPALRAATQIPKQGQRSTSDVTLGGGRKVVATAEELTTGTQAIVRVVFVPIDEGRALLFLGRKDVFDEKTLRAVLASVKP